MEHNNAKDKERKYEYRKLMLEEWMPYINKMQEKGILKMTGLADTTGWVMGILEFEDLDAFGKVWNDDKFRTLCSDVGQLVDNSNIRLCRPARLRPREEW
jgi:hypothetical protein